MRERLGQETKVSLDSPNLAWLVLSCLSCAGYYGSDSVILHGEGWGKLISNVGLT